MKTTFLKYKYRVDSAFNLINHKVNKVFFGQSQANEMAWNRKVAELKRKYLKNNIWDFRGIRLPNSKHIENLMPNIFQDTLFVYCTHDDNYDHKLIDELDKILYEGTYMYKTTGFDVTIHPGDIVIDAGAWIGDFSAYASVKGALVYAFEPVQDTFNYLKITAELNDRIIPIRKGLGKKSGTSFITSEKYRSVANQITSDTVNGEKIEITTIDEFVAENHLEKVDFLKSDIEGHERYMLMGAKETLKRFGPKLSICTYHLPDDPQVLASIIIDANPDYRIIQKRKKLYAAIDSN